MTELNNDRPTPMKFLADKRTHTMNINSIQVGDRIVCRPITRSGQRKVTRTVVGILHRWNDDFSERIRTVVIYHDGYDDFCLRDHEILAIITPDTNPGK